jgi:cytochrome c oxidase subunit II
MFIKRVSFCGILAIAAIGLIFGLSAPAAAHPPIDISAANWKFTPNTITVEAGQPVTLHVTATSGVHGIQSDELGIPKTAIAPGKSIDVTFTPKTAGTYKIHCAIPCGPGHDDMVLTIVVK